MPYMGELKQSTQVTKTILMIDSSDHVTGKTGLSAGITKYLSKAGTAASATMTTAEVDATNVKGVYSLVFTTSHTDTLGDFQLHLTATGADPADYWWTVTARVNDDFAFPTTSGRSIDVTATGEVGIDWSNIGAPTTTVDLSGTTIKTTQKVDVDTIKTNPVVNGGTITFPTNATVASTTNITAGTITTATSVTNRVTANTDQWAGGTIPTPNVTGVPIIDLKYILGTVLTETAGQIAAGFKKFFNIATPAATMDHLVLVDTVTTYTGDTPQTGDAYAKVNDGTIGLAAIKGYVDDIGVAGAGLTAIPNSAGVTTILADYARRTGDYSTLSQADVRSAVGLASANLDTQLDALPTAAENATAVLSAATSAPIDANVQKINDVSLTGDGSATPWGPA